MFSGQNQARPLGQRGPTAGRRSRLSSLAPAQGTSNQAPAPLPAARRQTGLLAPPQAGPSSQRRSVSPLHAGSSVNEEQQTTLTRELRKAEDGGIRALVKDEVHAVTQFGQLPGDVQEMVQDAINTDYVRAKVDVSTGFAMVWSRKTCHVWNYAKRTTATPTCYTFPCPDPAPKSNLLVEALASLALGSLVHHGSLREPGLLLVSPGGELRLWDSLSLALSGVEKFQTTKITLNAGEYVRCLTAMGPHPGAFILATSDSRLFRVVIFAGVAGRPTILASVMARGWSFASVGSLFRGAADPKSGIIAAATAPSPVSQAQQGTYDVWAVESDNLQRWRVSVGGGEQMVLECDVRQTVMESLVSIPVDIGVASRMHLQFLDVKVTADGLLCLLVSHIDPTSPDSVDAPHLASRSFAIVLLDASVTAAPPIISSVVKPAYKAIVDPRPESSPRLDLPRGGPAAFISFADAVVIVSLQAGSQLEEVVALKESAQNRVIGSGCPEGLAAAGTVPELTIVTTGSGLLKIEVHPQAVVGQAAPTSPDAIANQQTAKLKTKLDQAVYFGDDPNNPVTFELRSDFRGDLDTAAQLVSDEILASSSVELAADSSVNLRNQLGGRARYHQALIKFIGANGLLGRLSQSTRRRLASNAELLNVASQLWQYQNKRMEGGEASTLLSDAIIVTMEAIGEGAQDDTVRLFFKTQVAEIPAMISNVKAQLQTVVSSGEPLPQRSQALLEGNDILLVIYRALLSYRQLHFQVYGLEGNPAEPWSSTLPLLDVLQYQSDATFDVIRARTRQFGQAVDQDGMAFGVARHSDDSPAASRELQSELKKQATDLADFLLRMYDERLSFLIKSEASPAAVRAVEERYLQARPRAIKGLVEIEKASHAFILGEQYQDFRTLVELCHGKHGSPRRLETYMNDFKEGFAFELYQWYIEQGRYKELLDQPPAFSPYLTAFLDRTDYAAIAWLQDLETKRFEHASSMLLRESVAKSELAERKLMLSIGKLCTVAQSSLAALEDGDALDTVNGRLDIVTAQENLVALCEEAMTPQLKLQSVDAQAQSIANTLAPQLPHSRPAFAQAFTRLVKAVRSGRALSSEDLIDFYTLKANQGDHRGHFATALDIFQRADEVAAGRGQAALQTIWRRAFIHEDWSALRSATTLSDEQISNCLRETALYFLLAHIGNDEADKKFVLAPAQALFTSTEEDISARFSNSSISDLDAIMADYRSESEALQTAIDRDGLNDYYQEVVRLEAEDRRGAAGLENGDESLMQE